MEDNYKEKFYSKYVSTHNVHLYNKMTKDAARRNFPAFQKYYGRFLPIEKNAHIFDFGCGNGTLLYWLQGLSFDNAVGVDVSPEQINIARLLNVKKVFCDDARTYLSQSKTKHDVIFLRDVLGHFSKSEILDILELTYSSLKDGGQVIIKTPNAESPFAGQLRYGDFTHDVGFTRTSLQQLAEVTGFKKTEAYPTPPVVHGIKSAVRFVLWKVIELCLRFYRLVDAGSGKGIFTQNVIVIAYKQNQQ